MSNLWRVGNRLGRTLYLDDECVGMVDTPEIAARIVATMNGDASRIVPLVSEDPEVAAVLSELRIVKCYPDTVNSKGVWTSTFKIEVVKS